MSTTEPPEASPTVDPASIFASVRERAGSRPSLASLLTGASLEALDAERAVIRLGDREQLEFARQKAETIAELFRAETGDRIRVAFEAPAAAETEAHGPIDREAQQEAERHPLVRRAMELFDARVVRVEDRADRPGNTEYTENSGET